jgi:enoyl-CoA hydratase
MLIETTIEPEFASVVINRPEAMNAVSSEVLGQLHAALDQVDAAGVRVCIISGAGERAFSAGADLAEMLDFTPEQARQQLAEGVRLTRRLEQSAFVSIAAISGYALGGGTEIVLACSLRFAAPNAKFGLPEVTVGIFPGWGGIVRLPRQAPLPIALDMILAGRILTATEALRAGIIGDVVEDPHAAARQAAARLLRAGPEAQLLAKKTLLATLSLDFDSALELATNEWLTLMGSEQRTEGHRAFIEKREPAWARDRVPSRSRAEE